MQDRAPPAFQEYAASMLAKIEFRLMTLPEKGLLYQMRLECWVNHGLPENHITLAKVLSLDPDEVKAALPAVMPFFAVENGLIFSPELEAYRAHLEGIREKQSLGGKYGSQVTNSKLNRKPRSKQQQSIASESSSESSSTSSSRSRVLSQVQSKPVKKKKASLDEGSKAFVDEIEAAEAEAIEYERNAMTRKH